MRDLDPDARKELGARMNQARARIEAAVGERRAELEARARREQLAAERLDLTESLGSGGVGHRHVITQTWQRLEDVFLHLTDPEREP